MATTPRFALQYFGGEVPGTFADDGEKFTGGDRLTLDRILAALEANTYHGGYDTDPGEAEAPGLALSGTDGLLDGGITYHYRISLIDAAGIEGSGSDEASFATPDPLEVPDPPLPESSIGGSLRPGLYYYALSALRDAGTEAEESALGPASTQTLLTGEGTVTVGTPLSDDAGLLRVWRLAPFEAYYTPLGTVTPGADFIDDGTVLADPNAANLQPVSTGAGTSRYAITVTLTGDDVTAATGGAISAWRIYRTAVSGVYQATSLVHEVVETVNPDGTGGLITSWEDTGDGLVTGQPQEISTGLRLQPYLLPTGSALPNPTSLPEYYPFVFEDQLYVQKAGAWVPLGGVAVATTLPDPTTRPENSLVLVGGVLHVLTAGNWTPVGVGSGSALPDPTTYAGKLWILNGVLQISDGTTWSAVGAGGGGAVDWQGPWDATTQYSAGQLASFADGLWLATSPVQGTAPTRAGWSCLVPGVQASRTDRIFTAPDGTRYRQRVDSNGVLSMVSTTWPGAPAQVFVASSVNPTDQTAHLSWLPPAGGGAVVLGYYVGRFLTLTAEVIIDHYPDTTTGLYLDATVAQQVWVAAYNAYGTGVASDEIAITGSF